MDKNLLAKGPAFSILSIVHSSNETATKIAQKVAQTLTPYLLKKVAQMAKFCPIWSRCRQDRPSKQKNTRTGLAWCEVIFVDGVLSLLPKVPEKSVTVVVNQSCLFIGDRNFR